MSAGDLDARVPESGDAEIAAVADALNRLAETLQQEEGLRKESVADLAHELRTPVQGMLARVEAAQDGVLDDEAANLSAMHDEALRLARLLDDLSALAEAERPGPAARGRAGGPRRGRRRADGGVRRRVRRQGHRPLLRPRAGDRRRRAQTSRAGRREPALQRPALHGRRRLGARRRAPRRRRGAARGARTPASASRRGPAARVHALLARREVALPGHRRRRHRALHRQGTGARARRRRSPWRARRARGRSSA